MEGYAKVAQMMNQHEELAVFHRFTTLNLQNLLCLQAELVHLETDLQEIAERDKASSERPYRSHDWWSLTQFDGEGNREQWDKGFGNPREA